VTLLDVIQDTVPTTMVKNRCGRDGKLKYESTEEIPASSCRSTPAWTNARTDTVKLPGSAKTTRRRQETGGTEEARPGRRPLLEELDCR